MITNPYEREKLPRSFELCYMRQNMLNKLEQIELTCKQASLQSDRRYLLSVKLKNSKLPCFLLYTVYWIIAITASIYFYKHYLPEQISFIDSVWQKSPAFITTGGWDIRIIC